MCRAKDRHAKHPKKGAASTLLISFDRYGITSLFSPRLSVVSANRLVGPARGVCPVHRIVSAAKSRSPQARRNCKSPARTAMRRNRRKRQRQSRRRERPSRHTREKAARRQYRRWQNIEIATITGRLTHEPVRRRIDLAGLLTRSCSEAFPVGTSGSDIRNIGSFTAAGLFGTCTRFPFHSLTRTELGKPNLDTNIAKVGHKSNFQPYLCGKFPAK